MIAQQAPVQRTPASTSVVDVLDHVLDRGIVIDAWVRVSLLGIDLLTIDAQVIVASIATYENHVEATKAQHRQGGRRAA